MALFNAVDPELVFLPNAVLADWEGVRESPAASSNPSGLADVFLCLYWLAMF